MRRRAIVTWGKVLVLGALVTACTPEAPPPKHPVHPIAESRAADLVARTFRDAGLTPEADRYVNVGREKRLRVDVAAAGRKIGVAYLTTDDWRTYGDALPPRSLDDSLVVATAEGGNRVLLLWASDYEAEDEAAGARSAKSLAAERRIQRDVRDFLHRAEVERWP